MIKIITLKYDCKICGKTEIISVRNKESEKMYQLASKCFDNKICLDCYCASEKALHGTAEKIEDILYC